MLLRHKEMSKYSEEDRDYVFRYPLQAGEKGPGEPMYHDRLVEMFRVQLRNILDLVIPVCGEKEVKIDGFKLLSNDRRIYRIFD